MRLAAKFGPGTQPAPRNAIQTEFAGRRPYRLLDARDSMSGRWEIWMDSAQARAVRAAQRR